jgi:hypothetical protein
MKRVFAILFAIALLSSTTGPAAQDGNRTASIDLVSTWTLTSLEQGLSGGQPTRVANPRGLMIFDAAGHAFEFVTSLGTQRTPGGQTPVADAQSAFAGYGGFWGNYRIDAAQKKITYRPDGAVSPQMMGGREFSRSFAFEGDRVTVTSIDEPHAPGGTRWVWERVPTVDNLSPLYRRVVGFWQHVVEKRVNLTTGAVVSESKRAPSVIVYTPAGFVGVHFPPLNRKPFAAETPTPEEARAALMGYVGYYGALTVYPGQVFHNILAGNQSGLGHDAQAVRRDRGRRSDGTVSSDQKSAGAGHHNAGHAQTTERRSRDVAAEVEAGIPSSVRL